MMMQNAFTDSLLKFMFPGFGWCIDNQVEHKPDQTWKATMLIFVCDPDLMNKYTGAKGPNVCIPQSGWSICRNAQIICHGWTLTNEEEVVFLHLISALDDESAHVNMEGRRSFPAC